MDKLTKYPEIITKILTYYVDLCNRLDSDPNSETLFIQDEIGGHYIWMNLGWEKSKRIMGITVYVRIINGKFWIEEDWTEDGIATELMDAGVPKEDIVLAFHDPDIRPLTGFAVA